jgi:hypothetical protein
MGHNLRAFPTISYLASYSNVDREKVGEGVITSDEQIADLLHVVQESERGTCVSNNT